MRQNRCDVVTPLAVVPSPKFQLYDVALVDAPASKLHVKPKQLLVKVAVDGGDGGGGGGGGGGGTVPPMKPV